MKPPEAPLIPECTILPNTDAQQKLTSLITRNKKFNLLYRASDKDFKAETFHKRCDNKGPTLCLLRTDEKKVMGGYTSIPWASTGDY